MLRLAIRVQREAAELVLAELLDLVPEGVEEVEVSDQITEYAVYGVPGELPALPDLTAAAGDALVEVHTSELADGWEHRWREFHRPLVLGDRLTVRPPWELPGRTGLEVVIDPGQAFGTGSHATTRMCLELMLGLAPGDSFLDLGCGSGVLAIAAAKLGWQKVLALDNDPASIAATQANMAANGVELEVRRYDLRTGALPAGDAVVANLLAPLLRTLAAGLAQAPAPPHWLIAGGLLASEADEIAACFKRSGLIERTRHAAGDWATLLLSPR